MDLVDDPFRRQLSQVDRPQLTPLGNERHAEGAITAMHISTDPSLNLHGASAVEARIIEWRIEACP
jgi:hypothetical protein